MKIAIISDIHDNLANLERFLAVFSEEGEPQCEPLSGSHWGIICCGDVTTPETLNWLAERFTGPIKLACGNMEIRREEFAEVAKRHKNLEVFAKIGVWKCQTPGVEHFQIAFVHRPEKVEELAQTRKYRFVFYGHTHQPWIKEMAIKDCPLGAVPACAKASAGKQGQSLVPTLIANPGTLGGVFTAPTFAVLDTETGQLELKKLYQPCFI